MSVWVLVYCTVALLFFAVALVGRVRSYDPESSYPEEGMLLGLLLGFAAGLWPLTIAWWLAWRFFDGSGKGPKR